VTVPDEARLRRGHNDDQSHRGHQCSETMLAGESWFHISTPPPRGFEPRSLVTGNKGLATGPVRHGENEMRLQALHRVSHVLHPHFYVGKVKYHREPDQQNSLLPPCKSVERGSKVGTIIKVLSMG
jgi:hypothetical protein